jgi:zinc protease
MSDTTGTPSSLRVAVCVVMSVLALVTLVPVQAAVPPPKLQYQIATLPNGLRVILSEDHSTPIVHVSVWYHVGSKNEREGRTGFAHLFEHMMFKGSKSVEPESHISLVSGVGGRSNAYTTEDVTVFWQTLPSEHLPLTLWLEADRMATLRVDEAAFQREREVVKEERRLRIDSQPYGRLSEIIYDTAFVTHPYKHPTIGSMADLEAASIADVRDFHSTYYVPENATVTIVGDFDSAEALQLVRQYLGRVPKATRPVPREIPREPQMIEERRAVVSEAWPLPAVVVAFHIPYDGHPDSYPLHITSKILSDGQSARLIRELVYTRRLCLSAFGAGNLIEDPNLFYAVCIVQPGQSPEAAEAALIDAFEKLKDDGVTLQEVERAQNQFARDYILSRASNEDKSTHLAHAAVIHSDITTADGEFDIFMSTTADDVQRVARSYFKESNRVVLHVLPDGARP